MKSGLKTALMTAFVALSVRLPAFAANVYHVTPQDYKSALEMAQSGDVVYASPGTYTGSMYVDSDGIGHVVNIPAGVSFIAEGGWTNTYIEGGNDVRCAKLAAGAMLRGFTLRNANLSKGNGGAVSATTTSESYIVDSMFTNNKTAGRGGDGNGGVYFRCRFIGSSCSSGIAQSLNAPISVWGSFFDNHSAYSVYSNLRNLKVVNCTFGPNTVGPRYPAQYSGLDQCFDVYNCVILGDSNSGCHYHSCVLVGNLDKYSHKGNGTLVEVSKDAIAVADDFRPLPGSLLLDMADSSVYQLPAGLVALIGEEDAAFDINGVPRQTGSSLDIGAFEMPSGKFVYLKDVLGGLSVSGMSAGWNVLENGASATISVGWRAAERQCIGFRVNVTNTVLFADRPDGFEWEYEIAVPSDSVYIEAIYDTGRWWYVNPQGSDSNDGLYPGGVHHAFKTLAKALSEAKSGDTVWAAPGIYAEGSAKHNSNANLGSRAVIPGGVMLRSQGSAADTFIVGCNATGECVDNTTYATGTNGLRCVYMKSGSRLRGFTLTGGRAGGLSSYANDDKQYAGLLAEDDTCLAENCVISNNVAYDYAGCCRASFVGCRILANRSVAGGAACTGQYYGRAYNCLYDDNIGGRATMYVGVMLNCTIGSGNRKTGGDYQNPLWGVNIKGYKYVNLLIPTAADGNLGSLYNCVLSADRSPAGAKSAHFQTNSVWVSDVDMGLAADKVTPTVNSSSVLNWGDEAMFREVLEEYFPSVKEPFVDIDGNPRISNGGIDAGCFEVDFRPVYENDLNLLGEVEVLSASPMGVVETQGRKVAVSNGGELTVRFDFSDAGESVDALVEVAVSGDGTFTIYRDGASEPCASVCAADGLTNVVLSATGGAKLRFAFSGGGCAEISRILTRPVVVIIAPDGGLDVDGAVLGINHVGAAETLSFTLRRKWDSPALLLGVDINGVFHDFDNYPDGITLSASGNDVLTSCDILAVYAKRPFTWYVDANGGEDSNTGLHPSNAFKTLVAATTNAALLAGDTVKLLPGRYDSGVIKLKDTDNTFNRCILPGGVTLTSTAGRDKTVIAGAPAEESLDSRGWGCGYGSVRCLAVSPDSVVRDVMLDAGRAAVYGPNSNAEGESGGGIWAYDYKPGHFSLVEDVVITNCKARIGGGTSGGSIIFNRCKVIDCGAQFYAGGINEGCVFNSVVDYCNSYAAHNLEIAVNCTFGPNNLLHDVRHGGDGGMPIFNSFVLGTPGQGCTYHRCVLAKKLPEPGSGAVINDDCILPGEGVTAEVDCCYRPVKGANVGIDYGDNDAYFGGYTNLTQDIGEKMIDYLKGQRIYNAAIDVGAVEYDSRNDYANALGRRVSVVSASTNVTIASPSVRLNGAQSALSVFWSLPEGSSDAREMALSVSGEGVLNVYAEGSDEPICTLTGSDSRRVEIGHTFGSAAFRFEFAGAGHAELSRFRRVTGAVCIVK